MIYTFSSPRLSVSESSDYLFLSSIDVSTHYRVNVHLQLSNSDNKVIESINQDSRNRGFLVQPHITYLEICFFPLQQHSEGLGREGEVTIVILIRAWSSLLLLTRWLVSGQQVGT